MVQAAALTSGAGSQFLACCSQIFSAPATTWIQKHWWCWVLWNQLQRGQNWCLRASGMGKCKRHAHNPANTSKAQNKTPRMRLLAALQPLPATSGCHLGQKLAPVLGSAYHTASLIAPEEPVRGVFHVNTMLTFTKGLFMPSSYLLTPGGSIR